MLGLLHWLQTLMTPNQPFERTAGKLRLQLRAMLSHLDSD